MDTKLEEIEKMRNDPEIMASIREGLHDCHLGYVFKWRLVKGEFEGNFWLQRYCRLIVRLKHLWWLIKTPYQKFTHRNCAKCREYYNG